MLALLALAGCSEPHPSPPEADALLALVSAAWETDPPRAFLQAAAPHCRFPAACLCPASETLTGPTRWEADTLGVEIRGLERADAPHFDVLPVTGRAGRLVYWPVFVTIEMPCRLVRNPIRRLGPGSLAAQLGGVAGPDAGELLEAEENQSASSGGERDTTPFVAARGDSTVVVDGRFTGYLYLDEEDQWTLAWMPALP